MKNSIIVLLTIIVGSLLSCNEPMNSLEKNEFDKTETKMYRDIEFESQKATLRGRLYIPEHKSNNCPVVIMAHGFTTTINGMTADKYAERFREAGFAVALYDHRNLGISDGEPRQEINFWVQSKGYIDAIHFVSNQPEIDPDKIAVWGASLSSGEAFLAGTIDSRVKAVIAMIPAFGEEIPKEDRDGSSFDFAKETLLLDDIMSLPHTTTEQMRIVSIDQLGTPSVLTDLTAYNWFIEYGGRFGTNWKNIVSFSNIDVPDNFNLGQFADKLKAPILMVVATNDEMNGANPKVTKHVYDNILQPKEWIDIDGGHFGLLYYPGPLFDKSSKSQIDFLKKYLNRNSL
jgi:cephalosporin-C deacetylase-like acetyl esterase